MTDQELTDTLAPFRDGGIFENPSLAFKAIKNKYFQLEIPYSHIIVFSSLQYESGIYAIRKSFSFPYFHTMGPNGKSVFIEMNGAKRLVVDFIFEYQIEDRVAHYGSVLLAYLETANNLLIK